MSEHNFAEAMYRWVVAVRNGEMPDDEQYSRMLESTVDCIRLHLSDNNYYSREGVSELTRELDKNLMDDLLSELGNSLSYVNTKSQLSRLAGEYMFFAFDSYNIRFDLRDMVCVMNKAHGVMLDFKKIVPTLSGVDKNLDADLDFYLRYTDLIAEKMNNRIYREGRDRLATIVSFWESQGQLCYAEKAIDAAKAYSKIKLTRKESSARYAVANDKIDAFLDEYFSTPFKTMRKRCNLILSSIVVGNDNALICKLYKIYPVCVRKI